MEKTTEQRFFLVLGLLPPMAVCAIAFYFVPHFKALYYSLGIDLPRQTSLLVDAYPATLLLPSLVGVTWIFWPWRDSRGTAALIFGIAAATLALALGWWAAHAPIIALAPDR